jgi:hypothetical protein
LAVPNQGVATTGDGKLVPIALADLVPRTMPHKGANAEPDPGCEDCVAIRVLQPKGEFLSAPKLRITLPQCPAKIRSRPRGRQPIFVMQTAQHRSGAHAEALADPMAGEWCRGGHDEAGRVDE